jgi:hypothetical protein
VKKGDRLSEKQRRFVDLYMGEAAGNATEAARLAGYKGSDGTLRVVAAENLSKPNIQAAIRERVSKRPEVASRDERQEFYSAIMRGVDPYGMDEICAPIPIKDRLKACETLGKMQGDFLERHEVKLTGETTTTLRMGELSDAALLELVKAVAPKTGGEQ